MSKKQVVNADIQAALDEYVKLNKELAAASKNVTATNQAYAKASDDLYRLQSLVGQAHTKVVAAFARSQ